MSSFGLGVLTAVLLLTQGAHTAPSAPAQLLSSRLGEEPQPLPGSGDSILPRMSPDGRFILFYSAANDLVTNDNTFPGLDVFLHDRWSNSTVLVSANAANTGGGNGASTYAVAATNNQVVAFQSDATDLVAGDTNAVLDVFRRDIAGNLTELMSVATNGGSANAASYNPVISADGRYVAFVSDAFNLVADDTNGIPDVFVRDSLSQTTVLASVGAVLAPGALSATIDSLAITPDGRYLAFFSTARGLVDGVTNISKGEIYLRDLVSGTTTWVTTNARALILSVMPTGPEPVPSRPVLSDQGRFVAFKSWRTNGTELQPTSTSILQHDCTTAQTTIIASDVYALWAQNDDVYGPEMTPDGRFVAYVASNAVSAAVGVLLWDSQTLSNELVSLAQDGLLPTNSVSEAPALSPDGRFVVFRSTATNLTGNVVSNGFHLYRRDRQTGVTHLIDADSNGTGTFDCLGTIPGVGADGQQVVFSARHDSLLSSGSNRFYQVVVRNVVGGSNEVISLSHAAMSSASGSGSSSLSLYSLSDDGRLAVFSSHAADLAPEDDNSRMDVFLHDFTTGSNVLVSLGEDGTAAKGGDSFGPALSRGGQYLVFLSTATNLVAGRTNGALNVYLRDLVAGTNTLVSVALNGVSPGDRDASAPTVSQDGRFVAFLSLAGNLVSGVTAGTMHTYLRDLTAGTTLRLTNSSWTLVPSLSADGQYVAFYGTLGQLYVSEAPSGKRVFTNTVATTSAALSPSGARLLYTSGNVLTAFDLIAKTNLFSIPTRVPVLNPGVWSADGRSFVFVTATNAVASDGNGTNDVYSYDIETGSLTLVSVNSNLTAAANAAAESPAISGDGRFIVYRSFATDVVAGQGAASPNLFRYDRLTGSNAPVTVSSPGTAASAWSSRPAISGDGSKIVFQTWNSALVPLDLNGMPDVLGAALPPWGDQDTDGDGLPDMWMAQYFGHATGQEADLSRAGDDPDEDGMTNLEEFRAGTHPLDHASALRIQLSAVFSPATGIILSWEAVPGRSYQVEFKNSLDESNWQEVSGTVIAGTKGTCAVPAEQTARLFRVVAR